MIKHDGIKRYRAAKERFLKPVIMNFFKTEFPQAFGPMIREKVADELISIFDNTYPEANRLKPGQILWIALHKDTRGDSSNRKYVPVVLSLVTEDDVYQLEQGAKVKDIAERAIARIIYEAYEQEGILSSRDISLIKLCSNSHISRLRIGYENKNGCTLPHTGSLHDMGSTITHKAAIVKKVIIEKKDPANVAKECNHTQGAVDRYLKDYHRVKTVYKNNPDINYINLVTGIAKHVVKQYIGLFNNE